MSDAKKTSGKPSHAWRENIEALIMAIAVALLFKVFILEISKIPSGSMQPTLMGSPATSVFDRVLVDKLSFGFRDPERFEIVVFKHPLEQSRVMVKRLVGLPGESLRISFGDLWTRKDDSEEWQHLRRPPAVQEAMWRRLDPLDRKRSAWGQRGAADWVLDGRDLHASSPGTARYRPESDSILDLYTDGYHDSLRVDIGNHHPQSGRHAVGDLRLEGEVEAKPGTEGVTFHMTEGFETYSFHLPGPASPLDTPSITWRGLATDSEEPRVQRANEPLRLEAGDRVSFAVENLDDRLALEVNGELLISLEVDPQRRQDSTLSLELHGAGADFEDLTVYRDLYYYFWDNSSKSWEVEIPEGNYVVLGDNTQDSADSRYWESVPISWKDDSGVRSESGNYRDGMAQPNPIRVTFPEGKGWAFRDTWGERHWLSPDRIVACPIPDPRFEGPAAPLIPRHLILGRAMAVFWPLSPTRRLWRLGWLH